MRKTLTCALAGTLGLLPTIALGADDLNALRQQIEQLKQEYEGRIQSLERRLEQTAQAQAAPTPTPSLGVQAPGLTPLPLHNTASNAGNAFNPAMSIILDGAYYHDDQAGAGASRADSLDGIHHAHADAGEATHAHAHGGVEQGFNLRGAEMAVSASVDPYFDARAQIVFSEDAVAVEEAYFRSRSLPAGLQLKGGKFLSGIGYANEQHPHQWDFTDQNLVYQVLLGGEGLSDNGLQLTWLPDWPVYTRFGLELFQGRNEKMGSLVSEHHYSYAGEERAVPLAEEKAGPRLWTAFAKFSPDLGYDHALQGGLFYLHSNQLQELHGDDASLDGDDTHALQGESWLLGTDWVYKYDSPGAYGQGDVRLQAEYLYQVKDHDLIYHAARPAAVEEMRKFTEDGFYLQGVYGFAPRWEAGVRYDVVGLTNQQEDPTGLLDEWDSSSRWGLMLAFRPTEYSVLRGQFTRSNDSLEGETAHSNQFWLQYQLSLGVHGAHAF